MSTSIEAQWRSQRERRRRLARIILILCLNHCDVPNRGLVLDHPTTVFPATTRANRRGRSGAA